MEAVKPKFKRAKKVTIDKKMPGSDAVLHALLHEEVETIFGYPGGAIMPIYDSLHRFGDRLNHILVRHEQGAVHAAQGYARTSGKVGVCFATSGPGATNLITGIADAMIDSTPIVCITGQVPSHLLGTDAFQETDVVGISMPVTKWNYQVTTAEEIPDAIAKAFFIARSGRPGPVLIDITKDAQFQMMDYFEYSKCIRVRSYVPRPILDITQIEYASALINRAKKPFILCGQGVLISDAQKELIAFAEKGNIPVASTLLGLSAFPTDHPLYVGYLGMHGNYGPNIKTNECDVIIAVGMRFDDRVTGDPAKYGRQAKVIHIEIDKSEINKVIPADVAVHADAAEALAAMQDKIENVDRSSWLQEFRDCDETEYEKVIDSEIFPKSGKLKMGEVVRKLSDVTEGKSITVTDVGQHQMVTSRYYQYKKPYSNITSGGLGTMGFALPAAMGAQVGEPKRQVVAIIGDGGFQMTLQELGTIAQFKIPLKIMILNNSFLGMVRQWQQLFFESRYAFTEMTNPDFIKLAESFGIPAKKIDERANLESGIMEMLSTEGPYLMEVVVEKEENVFPMVPSGASVSDIRLE